MKIFEFIKWYRGCVVKNTPASLTDIQKFLTIMPDIVAALEEARFMMSQIENFSTNPKWLSDDCAKWRRKYFPSEES